MLKNKELLAGVFKNSRGDGRRAVEPNVSADSPAKVAFVCSVKMNLHLHAKLKCISATAPETCRNLAYLLSERSLQQQQ